MAKHSSAGEVDQYDPKIFKESLGSFGTTTAPGENQLTALQSKVRQGVKHVELHLASQGKGQFNQQDVPDKYGFEQRRTIMQLAKLNQQTLSVHGTFDINSFAGLSQGGFDEAARAKNLKEIDETIKFAAEAAKGGAVVFHLHETQLPTPPGELNLPKWYLEKLEKSEDPKLRAEAKKIKAELKKSNLKRQFQDNPDLVAELKLKLEDETFRSSQDFKDFKARYEKENGKSFESLTKEQQLDAFYERDYIEKVKNTDQSLVAVGNSIDRVNRNDKIVNIKVINGKKQIVTKHGEEITQEEKDYLAKERIFGDLNKLDFEDFNRLRALLLNGDEKIGADSNILRSLKNKLLWKYDDMLKEKKYMRYEADKEFYELEKNQQLRTLELKKEELRTKMGLHRDEIIKVKKLEKENRESLAKFRDAEEKLQSLSDEREIDEHKAYMDVIRAEIRDRNEELDQIRYRDIGQMDYHELARYNETMAQLNEQASELEKKNENTKVLTDEIFQKNASGMGHLGLRALKYQLDLKERSKTAKEEVKDIYKKMEELEEKRDKSTDSNERAKLNSEIMKLKYKERTTVGVTDYSDKVDGIDVEERPLYIAPENIMAGYGYMDSLEEYKAVIRTSWDEFAKELVSNNETSKKLRERYEKELGRKIFTGDKKHDLKKAREIAKKHIGGTFDNAHAGVWLKYFRRKDGETDEQRLTAFNEWLNQEAENMAKEGIIKHIHFNDTQAKDDDHNLLGSGVLDIHDLRERLRRAGIKESLIVEAGGRGGNQVMHLLNAFEIFNPNLRREAGNEGFGEGYNANFHGTFEGDQGGNFQGSSVSDWVSARRTYENRPQYSQYGMSYNTFKHQAPQQGQPKGDWSGTGFF